MNRHTVIQAVIDRMKAKTYLEIDVRHGRIITKVKCNTKIGIEPKFRL